jgi:hypothetical protein
MLDEQRMIAQAYDTEVPFKWEVCPTCNGRGRHVNPAIDCNGITAEDFDQEPGFREEYMAGMYDVRCYNCDGKRVVPVMDRDKMDDAELERIDGEIAEDDDFRRMQEAERRFGA